MLRRFAPPAYSGIFVGWRHSCTLLPPCQGDAPSANFHAAAGAASPTDSLRVRLQPQSPPAVSSAMGTAARAGGTGIRAGKCRRACALEISLLLAMNCCQRPCRQADSLLSQTSQHQRVAPRELTLARANPSGFRTAAAARSFASARACPRRSPAFRRRVTKCRQAASRQCCSTRVIRCMGSPRYPAARAYAGGHRPSGALRQVSRQQSQPVR